MSTVLVLDPDGGMGFVFCFLMGDVYFAEFDKRKLYDQTKSGHDGRL